LKEGACQDFKFQEQIAKLLRYETDKGKEDDLCSMEEYISRCPPEQKNIYYLIAPNRGKRTIDKALMIIIILIFDSFGIYFTYVKKKTIFLFILHIF
jgi:hypothetical protein